MFCGEVNRDVYLSSTPDEALLYADTSMYRLTSCVRCASLLSCPVRAEVLARKLDKSKLRHTRSIRELDASGIRPGVTVRGMKLHLLGAEMH